MSNLILGTEVYSLVSAALEVLKRLGPGSHGKPYENALVVEITLRGMSCQQQRCFDVVYKGTKVGEYIPDLIANDAIIIEPKVIDKISDHERGRMINYLRITGLPVGLILNFQQSEIGMGKDCPDRWATTNRDLTRIVLLIRVYSRFSLPRPFVFIIEFVVPLARPRRHCLRPICG
ncbi:MAG TPA: GxxExxY protein [Chthoniobacterales bacterium]|nr:GxxExxY protein [Chthoniobacterales bacterium]